MSSESQRPNNEAVIFRLKRSKFRQTILPQLLKMEKTLKFVISR